MPRAARIRAPARNQPYSTRRRRFENVVEGAVLPEIILLRNYSFLLNFVDFRQRNDSFFFDNVPFLLESEVLQKIAMRIISLVRLETFF